MGCHICMSGMLADIPKFDFMQVNWLVSKKTGNTSVPRGKNKPVLTLKILFSAICRESRIICFHRSRQRRHTTTDIEGHTYLHIWELCHPGKLTHGSSKEYWIQLQKTEAAIEFKKNDTTVQIISLVSSRLLLLAKFHNRRFLEGLGSTWLIVTLHAYLVEITAPTNL